MKFIAQPHKLIVYRQKYPYKDSGFMYSFHSLKEKSLDDCIDDLHHHYTGNALKGLSRKQKLIKYFHEFSRAEAEFYADEVEGNFVLKMEEWEGVGPKDIGIAHSLREANEKLKGHAFTCIKEWKDLIKKELKNAKKLNGTAPGYDYDNYIVSLEETLANFEIFDLTKQKCYTGGK